MPANGKANNQQTPLNMAVLIKPLSAEPGLRPWLKRILPTRVKRVLAYRRVFTHFRNSMFDCVRYIKYSSLISGFDDEEKLRAMITATYHNLEKGLSLSAPRPGFGLPVVTQLIEYLEAALRLYGPRSYMTVPVGALQAYVQFNKTAGISNPWVESKVVGFQSELVNIENQEAGGTVPRTRADLLAEIGKGGMPFFLSRSSCRQYAVERPVSMVALENAARIAQKSPVVCNRQSGRVRYIFNRKLIDQVLAMHGGARGFSTEVPLLLCVTADIRNFAGSGERYQGWIDGGMFAMSLILGLHAEGLGTCCLNWSREQAPDRAMHEFLEIPEAELIIMFVAVGHVPNDYVVAKSVRKPISEILLPISLSDKPSS